MPASPCCSRERGIYDLFQIDRGDGVPSEEDEEEENGFEERKDDSDDDGGGWITPSNIQQIQRELGQCAVPKDVRVGCVTTDFAMQVGGWVLAGPRLFHNLSRAEISLRFRDVYTSTL